jgi:hypothetical protein
MYLFTGAADTSSAPMKVRVNTMKITSIFLKSDPTQLAIRRLEEYHLK